MTAAWAYFFLVLGFVLGVLLTCLCHAAQRGDEERERAIWERATKREKT